MTGRVFKTAADFKIYFLERQPHVESARDFVDRMTRYREKLVHSLKDIIPNLRRQANPTKEELVMRSLVSDGNVEVGGISRSELAKRVCMSTEEIADLEDNFEKVLESWSISHAFALIAIISSTCGREVKISFTQPESIELNDSKFPFGQDESEWPEK